ncbi:hypothetical protein Pfo_025290 [Paulownia fortunei]|nr:hypothetical protein Pfo_025290 [Paulownia fortunei]
MTNEEEGNSEMLTNIESLPDEMVFKILLHLPAQDIYDVTRLVCRKWCHMIHTHNFIYAHLQHSTCGLLIQNMNVKMFPIFVALQQGRIEISRFSYKFRDPSDINDRCALSIANPATKQHFALPPFFHRIACYPFSGIAYAVASMEYKVVHIYDCDGNSKVWRCAILTVGVDSSWRHVHTEHLSLTAKELLRSIPLITEGFMHWADGSIHSTHVLTLNVETEIITQSPVPQGYGKRLKYYFSMGSYLSLLIACSDFSWDVWEMKPETGEWTKLPNIDLEAQKCTIEQLPCVHDRSLMPFRYLNRVLTPVGWLKYQEVLVFHVSRPTRVCIAYNVHAQEIDLFELDSTSDLQTFRVHRNSLVWLDGC